MGLMKDAEENLLVKHDNDDDHGVEVGPSDIVDGDDGKLTGVLVTSIIVAVCGSFVGGFSVAYSSPVESAILSELGLSTADYSLFGSMLTIGGLLGSVVCGKIADYIGRKATMWLADILYLIGWLAIAFSQGIWSLDLGRLVLGFATALMDFVVPVYIAEISSKNLRGGSVFLSQFMFFCGIAAVLLIGLITSWRVLALMGILPCVVQLLGLFFIPESPRWLVKLGCDKDYEAALQRLRGEKVDISQEAADIKDYNEDIPGARFFEVFNQKYAYALTVGLGLMALASFGGTSAILYYATAIFESAGFSGTIGTVGMALIQLPPTALGIILMDKFGRWPLLMYSAAGMSVACLSLALSFFFQEHGWFTGYSPYLAFIGISTFSAAYPVGMGGIPYVIMSEIFPINVKGVAGSLAIVVSYMSDLIVSYAFNFIMDWSSSGTFFIFTSINVFSLLFVAKLVPETKGRALEEIQYSLFGSMLSFGGLLGAPFCGKLADHIGRRAAMGLADVLYFVGWLSIAFSQGGWSLDFGRLVIGFANSLFDYVVPVYISDIAPKNIQGGSMLLCQLMYSCGMSLVYLVGLITNWRVLALIGIFPCLIQLLGLFFIPESPRWLVKLGRDEDYEASLKRLRGENTDISQEAAEIKDYIKDVECISGGNFLNVFRMKYLYALTVSLGLMALGAFGGTNGIFFYATAIFESAGFSGTTGTIALALIQLPPTALSVLLMENFGRRPLLMYSAGGMGTACLSLAISFLMKEHGLLVNYSPYLALAGILIFCVSFAVGMGGIPFVIMSEVFPINIKGAAGSLAIVVSYSSGWVISYTFNFLMDWSSSGTFFIFTTINVLSLLFVAKLVPETKGRTLEEIQESLVHISH